MRAVHTSWLDLAPEPWKNGGGVTRTLAVDAAKPTGAAPRWRVSIADIERDGAYSRFDGYDRVSVVLSGAGVALRADGAAGADVALRAYGVEGADGRDGVTVTLRPGVPTAFPGDVAMQAQLLDGPVRVLNLFVLRGSAVAEVEADATLNAGALPVTPGPVSTLRIVVAGSHFHIDTPCPGAASADDSAVGQDPLPPGAVQIVLRMAAPAPD